MNHSPNSSLPTAAGKRIGVFDSGVGGLSVLKAMRQALPGESFLYFADSAHAPYGERDDAYVLARSLRITEHLIASGCEALVIACNTATAVAADALRQRWPELPIVGVEPGIKPAVALSRNHHVGVMATHSTLNSRRFMGLLERHSAGAQIVSQACTGLARAIETGDLHSPQVIELVRHHCAPLQAAGVDTVVLGCTHYAFVRDVIEQAMGRGVVIVDTAQAVAKEVARRLHSLPPTIPSDPGLRFESSADATRLLALACQWLELDASVAVESASNLVPGTGVEPVRPFSGSGGF